MLAELKKLGKHALIYGTGVVLTRAVGFLLIPLYTHYLTPKDYGTLELIDLTGYIIGYFMGMGLDQAVVRYYHQYADPKDKEAVLSTATWFTALWCAIMVAILVPLTPVLSQLIFGSNEYAPLLMLSWAGLFLGSVVGIQKAIIRAQLHSKRFMTLSLVNTGISVLMNIYFIAILRLGVRGMLYSGIISSFLIGAYLWSRTVPRTGAKIDMAKLDPMIRYGLPFVPGGIFAFVLNWSDRYFLRHYVDIATVGLYALGYKLGMIVVMLISVPFKFVWSAYIFEIQKRDNAREIYARVATYFLTLYCFVGLAISVLSRELVYIMADPSYRGAEQVIPLVVLGMILMSSDNVFQVGLLIEGRSGYLSVAKGIAAVTNVGLNLVLIPRYGMMGAAWSTTISFGLYCAGIVYAAQKVYPVPFELARLARVGVAALAIFAAASFVRTEVLWRSIAIKSGLLLLFPVLLLGLGFLRDDEAGFVTRKWRALVKRVRPRG